MLLYVHMKLGNFCYCLFLGCELVASASTTSNNLTSDRKEAILDQISADQDSIVSELDKINGNSNLFEVTDAFIDW